MLLRRHTPKRHIVRYTSLYQLRKACSVRCVGTEVAYITTGTSAEVWQSNARDRGEDSHPRTMLSMQVLIALQRLRP